MHRQKQQRRSGQLKFLVETKKLYVIEYPDLA